MAAIRKLAVFLDRDGVLMEDLELVSRPEQVRLYANVPKSLFRLQRAGFLTIVVTNQPVVARGIAREKDVALIHKRIEELLKEAVGGGIDSFYFCPHHPNATLPQYRVDCVCRKPRPGMLLRAASEHDIDLESSYMIGDRGSDISAGRAAQCTAILVETGMHLAPPIESSDPGPPAQPDVVLGDLEQAVDWILAQQR